MVHRTYYGLGPQEAAVREFDGLKPYVVQLLELRADCVPFGPDHMALGIALDGLQTAAYHFTRRRHFYHQLEADGPMKPVGNGRLNDRAEAIAVFQALTPYADHLRRLRGRCRPFGRDYLALDIAKQSLESAAFHFTREANFYGARGIPRGRRGQHCDETDTTTRAGSERYDRPTASARSERQERVGPAQTTDETGSRPGPMW